MDLKFIIKHDEEIKRAIRFDVTVVPSIQGIHKLPQKLGRRNLKERMNRAIICVKNIVT